MIVDKFLQFLADIFVMRKSFVTMGLGNSLDNYLYAQHFGDHFMIKKSDIKAVLSSKQVNAKRPPPEFGHKIKTHTVPQC